MRAGKVARCLRQRGHRALGIDLSEGMARQVRALSREVEFRQGDMLALRRVPEGSLGG